MFRQSPVQTWTRSIRSLLLREPPLSSFSEQTAYRHFGVRQVEDRKDQEKGGRSSDGGSSLSGQTSHSSTRLPSFSSSLSLHLQPPKHFNPVSYVWECFIRRTFFQSWKQFLSLSHLLLGCIHNAGFHILQVHPRPRPETAFSSSKDTLWILGQLQSKPHRCHQSRAVHHAAPRVAHTWRDCLSPENENRCRQNLQPNWDLYDTSKVRKGQRQEKSPDRWASILVALCCIDGEPSVLFTLRSCTLKGRHKGDVSFAGGKSDPSDKDVVATALREAREELGIKVPREKVWGILKPLRDMSGMRIVPVLANLGPLEELTFKPNPEEVDEIFTLSLSHLCNPQNRGYTHFRTGDEYGYTLPVFRNGKHRVWGLTAVALDHTLKLIVP